MVGGICHIVEVEDFFIILVKFWEHCIFENFLERNVIFSVDRCLAEPTKKTRIINQEQTAVSGHVADFSSADRRTFGTGLI